MTKIIHRVMMPPLPIPSKTLPTRKTARDGATAVATAPKAKHSDDSKTMTAGEKIMARRPAKGDTEDMLMR